MDKATQAHFENLDSKDRAVQNKAFSYMMNVTENPVGWAYEVWDKLVEMLTSPGNHDRAIGAQVLCNLAKSDPKYRMKKFFPKLLEVTKDERFVTARHCMQSLWKVGAVGKPQQKMVLDGLTHRFQECATEKNCTLIRYDILVGLRNLYDRVKDEKIRARALELIETEDDLKYRKKYATVWRK